LEDLGLRAFYKGRKVFLTGHSGFKGAWLAWWLLELGAEVTGYALEPADQRGNLFLQTGLGGQLRSVVGDLDDLAGLRRALDGSAAELVLHLAAQPIVLAGYDDPVGTYRSNAQGTVHLLEAARLCPSVRTVLAVTTDKCYENKERPAAYREGDELGGHDPYSSSKAMAELAISAYRRSFLAAKGVGLASARAGNVIGGGDYAPYRIIPDIVEAISQGRPVLLRNPDAVRPWQHVLDALHGYLLLCQRLSADPAGLAEPFNFSPDATDPSRPVLALAEAFIRHFGKGSVQVDESTRRGHEAVLLSLDNAKARQRLGWRPQLGADEAIQMTAAWYADVAADPARARQRTLADIRAHMQRSGND
jgi:CDP-glucose 4,6-dehydratase